MQCSRRVSLHCATLPNPGPAAKGAGKTVESVFYFITKMTLQVTTLADRRTATMIHGLALSLAAFAFVLVRQ